MNYIQFMDIEFEINCCMGEGKIERDLREYLFKEEYIANPDLPMEELHEEILGIIKVQSEDLVRLRSQNLQYKKSLKELQDKVSIHSSNSNNTESQFMLSSQFKSKFQEFMKESLSLLFGSLLPDPSKYYRAFTHIVKNHYLSIQSQLHSTLTQLAKILKVEGEEKQLLKNVLKIIQDNHNKIFTPDPSQYFVSVTKISSEVDIEEEEFNRIFLDYHHLVIYMVLQEDKWEIVFGEEREVVFSKKEYTCVDGWIKEKENALLLIEGLTKNTGPHPNLKNYVIPIPKGYSKPIELPVTQRDPPKESVDPDPVETMEQEQKRIKTVEEPMRTIGENHFEASVQLEKRSRKSSVSNLPMKVTAGKIIKQTGKISSDRRQDTEISRGKGEKRGEREKQNICLNVHHSKITNYKQIIKKKFIKEDNRSLMRSRDRLMCLYDSSMPFKTERNPKEREGSSQNRKKKEENRPLKPTEEHIARFKAKHKLL